MSKGFYIIGAIITRNDFKTRSVYYAIVISAVSLSANLHFRAKNASLNTSFRAKLTVGNLHFRAEACIMPCIR